MLSSGKHAMYSLLASLLSPSDQGVCFPIQRGIVASRSKVKYFRHNDMEHLESLLEERLEQEKKVIVVYLWCALSVSFFEVILISVL